MLQMQQQKMMQMEIYLDIKFNKVVKTGKQCTILFGGIYKNSFNNAFTNIGNLPYTPKCMITDSGAVSTVDINQLHDVLSVKLDTNGSINVADWGTTGGKTIVINTTYICQ